MIAENLIRDGRDHILDAEPKHGAESMLGTLESLWKLRAQKPGLTTMQRDKVRLAAALLEREAEMINKAHTVDGRWGDEIAGQARTRRACRGGDVVTHDRRMNRQEDCRDV
jgi:hypothetical protein